MPLVGYPPRSGLGDSATDTALASLISTFGTAGANVITANALKGNLYTLSSTGALQQVIPAGAATNVASTTSSSVLVIGAVLAGVFLLIAMKGRG